MTGNEHVKTEREQKTGLAALLEAGRAAGAEVLIYVPGYPITEAAQALGEKAQMAVNEKVALEVALGSSATGQRSLVLVKHLGMNLLADPLSISPTHTIGSGLVILVGEDVGPRGSQIELDVRHYGPLCQVPVLDPPDPESLRFALGEAYLLSERISAPVVVRVTFNLSEDADWKRDLPPLPLQPERLPSKERHFDRSIWDLTAKGRHQRYREKVLPQMAEASKTTPLNLLRRGGAVGVIASGRPARLALSLDPGVSLLVTGYAHPLPWDLIQGFVKDHHKILVAEEPASFIESRLGINPKVRGKLTGHLPWGRLEFADLKRALRQIDSPFVPHGEGHPQTAKERGSRNVCDDCPYWTLYEVVRDLDVSVAGDAGCSIRAVRPPLEAVDVVYGLGSSIGVASGFKEKGVAIIGDYALIHSGLQGLIDALQQKRDVLVVLLQNKVAAMTGGQPVPDMVPLLDAMLPRVRTLEMPTSPETVRKVIIEELDRPGLSVVVATATCPRYS
jgi:indolepyruvate ferredoxin oxidoreductase alpha subunit